MPHTADRCKETTTTTGTGTVTLLGAVSQFQKFNTAFSTNVVVQYAIVGQTGTEWEVGRGLYIPANGTLQRDTIMSNSNANNTPVNLSSGTKDVFATLIAEYAESSIGSLIAYAKGWSLP